MTGNPFEMRSVRLADGWLLDFPICPPTNHRMMPIRIGRMTRLMLTKDSRNYMTVWSRHLWLWAKQERFAPITGYQVVPMWFILPTRSADNHNYFKVFFDMLEKAGVVTDDKFFIPQVRGLWFDRKDPRVIIQLKPGE